MAEGLAALTKAQALYDGKRAQEALREIGPALSDAQTSARAFGLQAMCLAQVRQVDAALRSAREAQAADPLDDYGYRVEGLIRVNHLKGAGALAPAREAVRISPSLVNQYVLVHALREKNQREEARAIASALAASNPQTPMALDALGICELRSRNWVAAEDLYRRAVALSPHEALYTTRLGEALQGQGNAAGATEAYLASARSDPTNAAHRQKLATAGVKMGAAGGAGVVALVLKLGALGAVNSVATNGFGHDSGNSFAHTLTILWGFFVLFFGFAILRTWLSIRRGAKLLGADLRAGLAGDRRRAIGRMLGYSTMWLTPIALVIALLGANAGWVCLGISSAVIALAYAMGGRKAFVAPKWIKRIIPAKRP